MKCGRRRRSIADSSFSKGFPTINMLRGNIIGIRLQKNRTRGKGGLLCVMNIQVL
ncbi:hypothetical protein Hanom_Chr02g00117001 [Helianthus anomalus]